MMINNDNYLSAAIAVSSRGDTLKIAKGFYPSLSNLVDALEKGITIEKEVPPSPVNQNRLTSEEKIHLHKLWESGKLSRFKTKAEFLKAIGE